MKHVIETFLSLIVIAALAALCGAQDTIVLGRNVQVSKSHAGETHYEVQLSADPKQPEHLLGCSMAHSEKPGEPYPSQNAVVAYVSFDHGSTWQETLELKGGAQTWVDPACALASDGTAYFAAVGYDPAFKTESRFYRSHDGGRTWTLAGEWPLGDREFITIDATGGKSNGRLYVNSGSSVRNLDDGAAVSAVAVSHSSDQGTTFKSTKPMITPAPSFVLGMGNGVVLSDGTLVVLFGVAKNFPAKYESRPTEANGWLKLVTSRDGGEHFSRARKVDDWYMPTEHTLVGNLPSLAVDQSGGPFRDRLYAAWADGRSGRYEILLASSSDKGETWSKPIVVNDDQARPAPGAGPDDFTPVVAVNGKGVVAVQWYDRRDRPDNLGWWTRLAVSLDGGESFLPSVKVSEAPFDNDKSADSWLLLGESDAGRTRIMFHPFHFNGGDTAGLAADSDGVFHPFWIDNRTGVPQIWTTSVTVKGEAARNGSAELSNLEDLTDRVKLEWSNLQFDPKRRLVSGDMTIENDSGKTIQPPLKLRLRTLRSEFAGARAANADNGESGPGAVWDFSSLVPGQGLKSGERTKPKHLEFHFDAIGTVRPQPDTVYPALPGVATFDAKVLGSIR